MWCHLFLRSPQLWIFVDMIWDQLNDSKNAEIKYNVYMYLQGILMISTINVITIMIIIPSRYWE